MFNKEFFNPTTQQGTIIKTPLEILNMVYPSTSLDNQIEKGLLVGIIPKLVNMMKMSIHVVLWLEKEE